MNGSGFCFWKLLHRFLKVPSISGVVPLFPSPGVDPLWPLTSWTAFRVSRIKKYGNALTVPAILNPITKAQSTCRPIYHTYRNRNHIWMSLYMQPCMHVGTCIFMSGRWANKNTSLNIFCYSVIGFQKNQIISKKFYVRIRIEELLLSIIQKLQFMLNWPSSWF